MLCCQFLCHVLKAIFFITIALKLSYFCQKMQNIRALGAPPPDPRASGGWELCPQTPSLCRLEASPPDHHWPPAAEGSAPRPQYSPPIANFWLRTWLLLHHFNVFGYNSTSIVMFVYFYCYLSSAVIFFPIYLFVTAKQLQQVVLKKLSSLGGETSNQ